MRTNVTVYMLNQLLETIGLNLPRTLHDLDSDLLPGGAAEARLRSSCGASQWRINGPVTELAGVLEAAGVYRLDMNPAMKTMEAVTFKHFTTTITAVIGLHFYQLAAE